MKDLGKLYWNQLFAEEKGDRLFIKDIPDFRIKDIFECGQCFRWNLEKDGSYTGVVFGKLINIKERPSEKRSLHNRPMVNLEIEGSDLETFNAIWVPYFDLTRNYGLVKAYISKKDPVIKKAIDFGYGIRVLRQDPWECLISFSISQNRSIPLIKKSIELLCERYGTFLGHYNEKPYYSFPKAEMLATATEGDLSLCKLGYRAKYIIKIAEAVLNNNQLYNEGLTEDEKRQYLLSLHGVGPKVANCILLFSMDVYNSFPIDVWIKRIMETLYPEQCKDKATIEAYANTQFGQFSGIAQQYLFHYGKTHEVGKNNG